MLDPVGTAAAPNAAPCGSPWAAADLEAFVACVGRENVLTGSRLDDYVDPYGFLEAAITRPRAAVRPASTEEVTKVVRAAGAHHTPLWPVSRGRNLGYGGASARVLDSVVLDLSRMDGVLAVDEDAGYAIVEPGVSFMTLAEHLRRHAPRLMPSVPDIGWGSVIGNTLERGFGYTAYSDHAAAQCGMEVVLADGEVVRTGMGAMSDSPTWALYKGGYGPSVDGLFFQSNLGVVTKMGVWLRPRPASTVICMISTPDEDDLEPLIELLRPLLLDETIQSNVVVGNAPVIASMATPRTAWWEGSGVLPAEVIEKITTTMGIGRWNARFACYGPPTITAARLAHVRAAVAEALPHATLRATEYLNDFDPNLVHPADRAQLGIPSTDLIQMAAWRGGTPAHTDFSLVCPPTGRDVGRQMRLLRDSVHAYGFDYAGGFTLFPRHAIGLAVVSFDRDNAQERAAVAAMFPTLIAEAAASGYAPYRSHLAFMDLVADQYAYNDSALLRLTRTIKNAVDPTESWHLASRVSGRRAARRGSRRTAQVRIVPSRRR